MKIVRRSMGPVEVLAVHGKMAGGADATELHDLLQTLAEEGRTRVVIDLANVPWIDSIGVGSLIRAYYAFVRRDGRLKLCSPNARVEEALLAIDLYNVFDVYFAESEAIAALSTRISEPDRAREGNADGGQ